MFGLIAGAIGAIGSALGSIATVVGAISMIATAIHAICKALGIIKEEKPEDLGDKALQAEEAGHKPEDFDTYDDYVKFVENFPLDPEKSKKYTPEEKALKGAELSACALQEKLGKDIDIAALISLAANNKDMFTDKRFAELGKIVKENPEAINLITGYLNKTEKNDEKLSQGMDILTKMEKAENPALSDREATRAVRGMVR